MRVFAGPRVAVPLVANLRAGSIGAPARAHRRLIGPTVIRSVVIRFIVIRSVVLKSVVIRSAVMRSAVMRSAVRCAITLLLLLRRLRLRLRLHIRAVRVMHQVGDNALWRWRCARGCGRSFRTVSPCPSCRVLCSHSPYSCGYCFGLALLCSGWLCIGWSTTAFIAPLFFLQVEVLGSVQLPLRPSKHVDGRSSTHVSSRTIYGGGPTSCPARWLGLRAP